MADFAKTVRDLRKQAGLTQKQLASVLEIERSTVTSWEAGRSTPTYRMLLRIAELFRIGLDELSALPKGARLVDETQQVLLPVYGPIQAGRLGLLEFNAEPEEQRPVSKERIQGGKYVYLRITGSCMAPRFQEGDLALVRLQPEVEEGEVAVVVIDEEATLKRVFKADGQIILQGDNPDYKPILADPRTTRIVGKVVGGSFDLER